MDEAYLNKIQQLVELQKIDDEIFEVHRVEETTPAYLAELETKFADVESRRADILDKLDHLEDQKKKLAIEIDDDTLKIKKSRNKLMQVGNDREYQAMMREMDSMERINRTREDEKLAILEALRMRNEELNEIDVEYDALKKELEEKRGALETTMKEAAEQLAALEKKRAYASGFIPEKVFQRYEFIRKRLEHPVIVDVEDGICSGCNIAVPPQTFIDLQSSEQILNCPNCQRIIFWSEHFQLPSRKPRRSKNEIAVEPEPEEAEDIQE